MTQFALVRCQRPLACLVRIDSGKEPFLTSVVAELLPDSLPDEIFKIDFGGKDIDSLVVEAQKQISLGSSYECTLLCDALRQVGDHASELLLWYGADYRDLETVCDWRLLTQQVLKALSTSSCEVYVRYFRESRSEQRVDRTYL